MKISLNEDGQTVVKLGPQTWLKLATLLAGLCITNATWQSKEIQKIGTHVHELTARMESTEKNVAEIRNDYRDLNSFLRSRKTSDTIQK